MATANGRGRQDVRGRSLLKEMEEQLEQNVAADLMGDACVSDGVLLPAAEF